MARPDSKTYRIPYPNQIAHLAATLDPVNGEALTAGQICFAALEHYGAAIRSRRASVTIPVERDLSYYRGEARARLDEFLREYAAIKAEAATDGVRLRLVEKRVAHTPKR